jgi:hypothetical protein
MRTNVVWAFASMTLAWLVASGTGQAQKLKGNEPLSAIGITDLTTEVEQRISRLPGIASIARPEQGVLHVSLTDGRKFSIGLANLHSSVNSDILNRDKVIDGFVKGLGPTFAKAPAASSPSMVEFLNTLVPVMKPASFIGDFNRATTTPGQPPKAPLLVRDLVGDVVMVVGSDEPTRTRMVQSGEGKRLGLTDEALIKRAIENLQKKLPSIKVEPVGPFYRILMDEPAYTASILSIPEVWTALENQFGQGLIVAVPTRADVVFVKPGEPQALEAIRRLASEPNRPYPITSKLLRWQSGKWTIVQ